MALSALPVDLDGFGDAIWRADVLARSTYPGTVVASGHPVLDAQLPGGGWPLGGLCEILQTHSAQQEWCLLLPGVSAVQRGAAAWVVLIGPPQVPFGPALAARGLDVCKLLWVKVQTTNERLWAAEQALRCADVAAVLAWLPQVQAAPLRRLHMAAHTHSKLLFVFRPAHTQGESSPAVLRLLLLGQDTRTHVFRVGAKEVNTQADPDALRIRVLKRRGPPLTHTLVLPMPGTWAEGASCTG